MLLCCFKEPKGADKNDIEDTYLAKGDDNKKNTQQRSSPCGISDSVSVTSLKHTNPPKGYYKKEKAPLGKEEKRLIKQKSRESLNNNKNATKSSENNFPFIDNSSPERDYPSYSSSLNTPSSPSNNSSENKINQKNPHSNSTPVSPVKKIAANNVPQSRSMQFAREENVVLNQPRSYLINNNNSKTTKEMVQTRGMTRSSASYGIQQMLQQQIVQEETNERISAAETEAKIIQKYESAISELHEKQRQQLSEAEEKFKIELINAKNNHQSELERQVSNHKSELDKVKKANESLIEKTKKECQQIVEEKQREHEAIVADYQQRDQAWHSEKQDILSEIQRLKDEANRFIAILAAEEEEENLSPEKKQNLTREVESLQLVVEMRTQELHKLRKERTKHLEQLEDLERTRNNLDKLKSKVEDLEAQLKLKSDMERQLSLEKSNLENCYVEETKEKDRVSLQMEQLQWRLRHKMEVPPTAIFAKPHFALDKNRPDSLPQSLTKNAPNFLWKNNQHEKEAQEEENVILRNTLPNSSSDQMTPNNNSSWSVQLNNNNHFSNNINNNNNNQISNNQNVDVNQSSGVVQNSEVHQVRGQNDSVVANDECSNFLSLESSASSENGDSRGNLSNVDSLQSIEKLNEDAHNDDNDGCLSDEGLGDISSQSSSPQPDEKKPEVKISDKLIMKPENIKSESPKSNLFNMNNNNNNNNNNNKKSEYISSPADERMPSRISLSVTTNV